MKYSDGHVPIVAVLGAYGSYSSIASQKYFGPSSHIISKTSIDEVFLSVKVGESPYGVVPLENSTAGSVLETYDHLFQFKLKLVAEVYLRIHHHLLGHQNAKIRNSAVCYSHPQAFAQCSEFFKKHSWIKQEPTSDTGSGVERVSKLQDISVVALGSQVAAETYGLVILQKKVENVKENFTRFGIISRVPSHTGNKISLIFSLNHVPGSLASALVPFAKADTNLTKIESRPVFNHTWEYIFYLDFDLGAKSHTSDTILKDVRSHVRTLTILGQYEKGKTYET